MEKNRTLPKTYNFNVFFVRYEENTIIHAKVNHMRKEKHITKNMYFHYFLSLKGTKMNITLLGKKEEYYQNRLI